MKKKFIVGNWKMHKTIDDARQFILELTPLIQETIHEVWIAPPATALHSCLLAAEGTHIIVGAQNISQHERGPFTGEISAEMVKEAGAVFVIIGHSERRSLFGESGEQIYAKVKRALACQLRPLLCIGESLEERQQNQTEAKLASQLAEVLTAISCEEASQLLIAYEPIWAIGSGLVATVDQAAEVHRFCRLELMRYFGEEIAAAIPLLYGGSVNATNAAGLLYHVDIDGVLVGSASLQPQSFSNIINYQNLQQQSICRCL